LDFQLLMPEWVLNKIQYNTINFIFFEFKVANYKMLISPKKSRKKKKDLEAYSSTVVETHLWCISDQRLKSFLFQNHGPVKLDLPGHFIYTFISVLYTRFNLALY
jgi:hypothetical protein